MWRLAVIEKVATLDEIEREWTFDDIARANAVLDMRDDVLAATREPTP